MADEQEVAPQTAEETNEDTNIVSIGDIAEAAGLGSSIFDNASDDKPEEEAVEESEDESEENIEPEAQEQVEEAQDEQQEPEEPAESEGVKKRIGKLIDARNKALDEVEELKEQLNKAKEVREETRKPRADIGLDRFDGVKTLKELEQREEEAEHLREWLLENPDGGEYTDIIGDTHEVDYDQARQLTVATDRDLRKNIPKVAKRLQDREVNTQKAIQVFDWMKDKTSAESIEIQKILEQNQSLKDYYDKDPFSVLTLGYAIEGIKAVNSRIANKNKQVTQPAPKVPSAPSRATPMAVKAKTKNTKALLKQAMSGEVDDAASYIESLL